MTALVGPEATLERLAADGVRTVEDVLARATCVRDLPDRSNHVLQTGEGDIHVKCRKRARRPREAQAIERVAAAGVPTATVAFHAVDPRAGALTGTHARPGARPLDDWLRQDALSRAQRRDALHRLATATARLHDAGLHHCDLYLNHVFARPDGPHCEVFIIDWERLGRHRRTLGRRVVKDLAALTSSLPPERVPLRERAAFLLAYLRARGVPRRGVYDGLVRRIRRKARRIAEHVPRTPVGDAARPDQAHA